MIGLLLLATLGVYGQRAQGPKERGAHQMKELTKDWTPTQRAELKTKKLTLHLDLTEKQQEQVHAIHLQQEEHFAAKRKEREAGKKLTSEELYQLKSNALDRKIAEKEQFKAILNAEQFTKFEKLNNRKHRAKRRHGMRKAK